MHQKTKLALRVIYNIIFKANSTICIEMSLLIPIKPNITPKTNMKNDAIQSKMEQESISNKNSNRLVMRCHWEKLTMHHQTFNHINYELA